MSEASRFTLFILYPFLGLFFPMCKTLHFDSLNSIFQSCAHWVNAFNEHCSASLSLSVLTFLPALESSANLDRKVRSSLITRSSMFIYITKHNVQGHSLGALQTKLVSRLMIYYCKKLSVIYRLTRR